MANTFKLATQTGINSGTTAAIYTCPNTTPDTTTVIIGLTVTNVKGASVNASVKINNSDGDDPWLIKDIPLPSGSSVEIMAGNKIVLNELDTVVITGSNASGADVDAILSYMEIT
jgi:hypothetical protein